MQMPKYVHGDTIVILSSWEFKKISELAEDKDGKYEVFSYNIKSDMLEKNIISNIHIEKYVSSWFEITFDNGEVLQCIDDQQLLISEETRNIFKEAKDLRIGDKLWGGVRNQLGILGEEQEIMEIKKKKSPTKIPVYDFDAYNSNENVLILIKDKMIDIHNLKKEDHREENNGIQ
jgi:hypothetical protein